MENNTKIRLLYIMDVLQKYTDEEHPLSTTQILEKLQDIYGVSTHRTTIPKDVSILQEYGAKIIAIHSTQTKYFVEEREFDVSELKLLIDAVEASKFITKEKSGQLISKLKNQASVYQAEKLKRNTLVMNRVKPNNEDIYVIVNLLNEAINKKRAISFQYYEYSALKKKVLRNKGETYIISPYHLIWSGDFYYLVGYSEKREKVVSFRVDRIAPTPKILRTPAEPMPAKFDLIKYTKEVFSMYAGEHVQISLRCENSLMKTIIDRFGEDVTVFAYDMKSFRAIVEVSASPTFYGWVFGFGGKIQILGPEKVKADYQEMVLEAAGQYKMKELK